MKHVRLDRHMDVSWQSEAGVVPGESEFETGSRRGWAEDRHSNAGQPWCLAGVVPMALFWVRRLIAPYSKLHPKLHPPCTGYSVNLPVPVQVRIVP